MSDDGVHIAGDVTATGSVIAGRDGSVVTHNTIAQTAAPATLDDLRAGLAELLTRVRAADDLEDRDEVVATVEHALDEAGKPRPRRRLLTAFLDVVGDAVAGLGAVSELAVTLRTAVDTVLGS
ncbi:hypothetical protein [Nocardia blacklockiae]|uniref:hypothetical protein n=1 Tax=Nocardia blacklockiae TaxID=480036 RepID=UPI00189507FE|nr:hypothetical protein [Nocardia blacklockiae]MBF6169957.1 hypothetical protein [Nocardia blacklockiae]